MKNGRLIYIAFILIISACVSKESIVIPPAKPFNHPQLLNLSAQEIQSSGNIITFGENKKYTKGDRITLVYYDTLKSQISYKNKSGMIVKTCKKRQMRLFSKYSDKSRFGIS